MRNYSQVSPRFWTGKTGRAIVHGAGKDATILALYLQTAPGSNLIGLYYCPISAMVEETALSEAEVREALIELEVLGFCIYDHEARVVYVRTMVRWQVGEKPLPPRDKRRGAIEREVTSSLSEDLRARWLSDHGELFGFEGASKGHRRGIEGASQVGGEGGEGASKGLPGADATSGSPPVPAPVLVPASVPDPRVAIGAMPTPEVLAAQLPPVRQKIVVAALCRLAEHGGFFGVTSDQHPVRSALERINDGADCHEIHDALKAAIERGDDRARIRSMFFAKNYAAKPPSPEPETPETARIREVVFGS